MRRLVAGVLALGLSGCSTLGYYWQAMAGQMELSRLARPVDDLLAAPDTPEDLKRRLELGMRMRDFASRELALPDNQSYRRYAALDRPYVVWNVFAAPELSLRLRTQCFPVAGCVVYRGFFSAEGAERWANELRREKLDVHVGGVPAYSTLGWFADPLVSTFIRYPDLELARLVFHELAHQVAYAADDSEFNESFAVAVEEEGLKRWMARHADTQAAARYEAFAIRRREVMALFMRTRRALEEVYASGADDDARRAGKAAAFAAHREAYAMLRGSWQGAEAELRAWDAWALADLNNARLGSIATYTARVPQFRALLARADGDLARFHAEVRGLAALGKAERDARLDALAPRAAAG